jgi:hypothetical protein
MSATALTLPSEQAAWRPKVNPWAIAATVSMAAFIEVLDTSVPNVALPDNLKTDTHAAESAVRRSSPLEHSGGGVAFQEKTIGFPETRALLRD